MALPYGTTGSLTPAFASARLVGLAVKPSYAFTLAGWFPFSLRGPSRASVIFWEATAPVKLPARQCPSPSVWVEVRYSDSSGWYFTVDSTEPASPASESPTYPTQTNPNITAKV